MPTFLLGLYIAMIFIRPMDWWEPVLNWELVNAAAILTLVVCFPRIMEDGPRLWKSLSSVKMAAGWVVAASLSWLPAFWLTGMQTTFEEVGKLFVLFFLIILLGRTQKGYRIILWSILLCTVWMAIHSIYQVHRGYGFGAQTPMWRLKDPETGDGVWQARAFGIFEDPNDLCLVFIMAVPLFYAEFRSVSGVILRGLALLGIPVVAYGAWMTNSRGGYLGIFAMVITYLMSRTKGFKRWFLLAFSLFFLTIFAPSRFAAGLIGQQDRSILWGDGIAMFKTHPVFGVGFGDFVSYSSDHKAAHNTYVHVLADTGVVGYLPFFLMIFFTMLQMRRAINLGPLLTKQARVQLAGLFSAGVGYLTSIYFLSRQQNHVLYILLALFIAKAVSVCQTPEMFNQVFGQSTAEYRRGVYWAFGSIIFMWITIRIVNAAG